MSIDYTGQDMLLMCKDTAVLRINFDEGRYDVLNNTLIPYQLKGKLREVPPFSAIKSQYDLTQRTIAINKNYSAVLSFLASRVLPLTRKNAKKIYQLFGFEQLQDDYSKAKIAIICKAVSLQDDYWFKTEFGKEMWKNVSIRDNHLSEIVAQVSLHGSSLTLGGEIPTTPEIAGQGAYAKAWKRENGELWLYKLGSENNSYESKVEVEVSNVLKKCNVNALPYFPAESNGVFASKCKCMTSDSLSILPGMDFVSYCNVNGLDADSEIMRVDADSIWKMGIVDYLISNRDRHGMNWGFYYDSNTMEIKGCHPLFDHNNAFDKALMADESAEYLFNKNYTMTKFAKIGMQKTDFYFKQEIKESDFIFPEHYESFMKKADKLGVKTKHVSIDEDKDSGYEREI